MAVVEVNKMLTFCNCNYTVRSIVICLIIMQSSNFVIKICYNQSLLWSFIIIIAVFFSKRKTLKASDFIE